MDWPQITYIVLLAIVVGIDLAKDGEPRGGRHNFITTLISAAIVSWLLWAGGFWRGGAC